MIITPEMEYPMVCVCVKQAYEQNRLKLDLINMNSGASWFHSDELEDMDGTGLLNCSCHRLQDFCLVMNLIRTSLKFLHFNFSFTVLWSLFISSRMIGNEYLNGKG
jgi:hypothetical protein